MLWQFLVLILITFILLQISTRDRVLLNGGAEDECVPPQKETSCLQFKLLNEVFELF